MGTKQVLSGAVAPLLPAAAAIAADLRRRTGLLAAATWGVCSYVTGPPAAAVTREPAVAGWHGLLLLLALGGNRLTAEGLEGHCVEETPFSPCIFVCMSLFLLQAAAERSRVE